MRHPDPVPSFASLAGISGHFNPSFPIKQAAGSSELHFTEPGLNSELVDVTGNVQVPNLTGTIWTLYTIYVWACFTSSTGWASGLIFLRLMLLYVHRDNKDY